MEISRKQQEEQIERIERQFYEVLLAYEEDVNNKTSLEREIQCVLESVRNTIMTFNFEDDLLLRLLEKVGYVLEYMEQGKTEPVEISYRLSA